MLEHQQKPPRSTSRFSSSKLTGLAASGVPSRGLFIIELVVALLITRIPYLSVPFKWLESYFHELSHGIATIISSGVVSHIQLFPNGAGFCFSQGGSPMLIGFAGYFGAACWGYLIYLLATWPKRDPRELCLAGRFSGAKRLALGQRYSHPGDSSRTHYYFVVTA